MAELRGPIKSLVEAALGAIRPDIQRTIEGTLKGVLQNEGIRKAIGSNPRMLPRVVSSVIEVLTPEVSRNTPIGVAMEMVRDLVEGLPRDVQRAMEEYDKRTTTPSAGTTGSRTRTIFDVLGARFTDAQLTELIDWLFEIPLERLPAVQKQLSELTPVQVQALMRLDRGKRNAFLDKFMPTPATEMVEAPDHLTELLGGFLEGYRKVGKERRARGAFSYLRRYFAGEDMRTKKDNGPEEGLGGHSHTPRRS